MFKTGMVFLIDLFFAAFYKPFVVRLFNFSFVRHPFYKQWQFLHFRMVRKIRKASEKRSFSINGKISFVLHLQPGADFHQHSLFVAGIYEKGLTSYILNVASQYDNFIDVGANIGYYTVLAASANPNIHVIAIEPCVDTFKRLLQNVETNNLKQVKLCNCAAGAEEKKGRLYISNFPEQNSLIYIEAANNVYIETDVKRIDDFVAVKGKNILVKIDTEGYEYEALKGMERLINENSCTFVFEYSPKIYKSFSENYTDEMLGFFVHNGYCLFEINNDLPLKPIDNIDLFIRKNKNKQSSILAKKNQY